MERDFLASRHFTFGNIRAQTSRFEMIMKELWEIMQRIITEKYRGGVIIDIFW